MSRTKIARTKNDNIKNRNKIKRVTTTRNNNNNMNGKIKIGKEKTYKKHRN